MFQNITERNAVMKDILENIHQGKEIQALFPKYPDKLALNLVEAINVCLANGYLTGISCEVGGHDDIVISTPNPKVTKLGLDFISEN